MSSHVEVAIAGHRLSLSNLDKVLYPKTGFTKAQVIDYYLRIAPALLPHLERRPITLKRYPDGVEGMFFYEKRCPAHRPAWITTKRIAVKSGTIDFCLVEDASSLVWLANIACLEIHAYLYRAESSTTPTMMVFDLDPGEPAGLLDSCGIGLHLRRLLGAQGLECLAKASGSKGLHVYVPLNRPVTFERTKSFARAVALAMEQRFPERVTSIMAKSERGGKVFIDWSQNDRAKTTCCAYSLRARERPTVSAPLRWSEIEAAVASGDAGALVFEADQVLRRVEKDGDLFASLERLKQNLPGEVAANGPGGGRARPTRAKPAARGSAPKR
jgi:bifunctional non-homologous end joining protein LigD